MLVSLMRAMKPKILESFKDYNAQKEFLAKINKNKKLTVFLHHGNNIHNIEQLKLNYNIINTYQKDKKIIVYGYNKPKKQSR